jgi:hypothetical protein
MPTERLPETMNDKVAIISCSGRPYPTGWYRLGQLRVSGMLTDPAPPSERPLGDIASVADEAGFMVLEPGCAPPLPPSVAETFSGAQSRQGYNVYIRRRGR